MKLLRYIRPYKFILIISLLLACVVGVLEAVSTFLIGSTFAYWALAPVLGSSD